LRKPHFLARTERPRNRLSLPPTSLAVSTPHRVPPVFTTADRDRVHRPRRRQGEQAAGASPMGRAPPWLFLSALIVVAFAFRVLLGYFFSAYGGDC